MNENNGDFFLRLSERNNEYAYRLPSRAAASDFIENLLGFLFPTNQDCTCKNSDSPEELGEAYAELERKLLRLILPLKSQLNRTPSAIIMDFSVGLPKVYEILLEDARTISNNDPASVSVEEVICIYPGFRAIATYRVAHLLMKCGVPLLPRMFTEHAHSITGIDIHPNAVIGQSFFIDHGTGVVIGETTIIGNHVRLYKGVTLGATFVSKSLAATKRHPTIEDHVVVYANATILGGETVIGHHSIIGGNSWILKSIPPYSSVYHQSQIEVRNRESVQ